MIARALAVVQSGTDQVRAFFIGTDGAIWRTQKNASDSRWTTPAPLNVGQAHQIAAAVNANGTIEIFHVGDDRGLWHEWQSGTGWTGPNALNVGAVRGVAAATNKDGRLEVFYMGENGSIYHSWQTAPSGGWTGASSIFNPNCGTAGCQGPHDLAAALNANSGQLELFAN